MGAVMGVGENVVNPVRFIVPSTIVVVGIEL